MHEFGWKPTEWSAMSFDERVLVIAMIQTQQEDEKAQQEKAEREAKSKARRH